MPSLLGIEKESPTNMKHYGKLVTSCIHKLKDNWKITIVMVIITFTYFAYVSNTMLRFTGYKEAYLQRSFEDRPIYTRCVVRHVVMAKLPFPEKTALASFPGSGNTWTRHLIQQLTGLATSSNYCDEDLLHKGFPFECHKNTDKERAIVTKTHGMGIGKYDKAVVLIRSPYEALMSYFKIPLVGHIKTVSEERLNKAAAKTFQRKLKRYIDFHHAWLVTFKGKVHLLQYSELKKDMTSTLRALASFLDVDVTSFELNCTARLQEGNYHRNVTEDRILQMKQTYTVSMRKDIVNAIETVKSFVKNKFHTDIDLGDEITFALSNR